MVKVRRKDMDLENDSLIDLLFEELHAQLQQRKFEKRQSSNKN